jgi:capsular exopolysaccharide synthesis family protein
MELRHYFDILRRRAIIIVIVAALTMTVVVTASLFSTPRYAATATVRVIQDVGVLDLRISQSYGDRLMNTYARVLTYSPVLEQAAARVGSPLSVGQLRQEVEIEVIPETELMRITVRDQDPTFAALLANTLAALLVEHGQNPLTGSGTIALPILEVELAGIQDELEESRQQLANALTAGMSGAEVEALRSQIQYREDAYNRLLDRYELARLNESLRANSLTIVDPASLPRSPFNTLGLTDIGVSLAMGVFGGIGLALVLENLDTRIHSPQQIEHLTRMPVLGTVPIGMLPLDDGSRLGHGNGTGGSRPIEEAYRLLGINMQALNDDTPLKTILITSAIPKEGKSTVAANLAQTLAERGQTVFLVEGDLRRPAIVTMLDIEDGGPGLGGLLAGCPELSPESLSQAVHPAKQPSLFVISAGPQKANPTALLASPSMGELLGYLGTQGQTTLLDAPPVLGVADVSVLAPRVDGVILVVRQAHSKREHVLSALKQLQASRAHVLGFVFLQKSDKDWGYH